MTNSKNTGDTTKARNHLLAESLLGSNRSGDSFSPLSDTIVKSMLDAAIKRHQLADRWLMTTESGNNPFSLLDASQPTVDVIISREGSKNSLGKIVGTLELVQIRLRNDHDFFSNADVGVLSATAVGMLAADSDDEDEISSTKSFRLSLQSLPPGKTLNCVSVSSGQSQVALTVKPTGGVHELSATSDELGKVYDSKGTAHAHIIDDSRSESADEISESDLLLRYINDGDSVAFGQFVQRMTPRAIAIAKRYTNSAEDAEDAVQNTFLYLATKKFQYQECGKFLGWFSRVIRNRVLELARKKKQKTSAVLMQDGAVDQITRDRTIPESTQATVASLMIEIDKLSDEDRKLLEGIFLDGYSRDEIANELRRTKNWVYDRLKKIRRKLRKELPDILPIAGT